MTKEQYVHISAALSLHELLLGHIIDSGTMRAGSEGREILRRGLRQALMTMRVPEGVKADDEALAIQRESLQQFDTFWKRLAESQGDTPPV